MFISPRDSISRTSLRVATRDSYQTFDTATIDSTGAFLIGELERIDYIVHEPLASVTWSRDISLREDVTIADESASFINSAYAMSGMKPSGVNWVGKEVSAINDVAIDVGKTVQPLTLWAGKVSYTIPELESAMKLGRPIDQYKLQALQLKHQMDIDKVVYIGDTDVNSKGLLNHGSVTPTNVVNGAAGSPLWTSKTADEIMADVNTIIKSAWTASGYRYVPSSLRLPPAQFSAVSTAKVSNAGNVSILTYLKTNNAYTEKTGRPLDVQEAKWLAGLGTSSTDRMMVYTNDPACVRFPMTPLQRTPLEYRGLWQMTTYYCRLGAVEAIYPDTIAYADGI